MAVVKPADKKDGGGLGEYWTVPDGPDIRAYGVCVYCLDGSISSEEEEEEDEEEKVIKLNQLNFLLINFKYKRMFTNLFFRKGMKTTNKEKILQMNRRRMKMNE
jgi:hypothetical protein